MVRLIFKSLLSYLKALPAVSIAELICAIIGINMHNYASDKLKIFHGEYFG